MPHIDLHTSADLPENMHIPEILEGLVTRLSRFETVDSKAIKAYHTLHSNWVMGESAPPGFAHCAVGIMEGRPEELKRAIADGMYEEFRQHFEMSMANDEVSLTLELREFHKGTYRKL